MSPRRYFHSTQRRHVVVLTVVAIALWAVFVRCLHLFNPDHYYIISADSHFFQWQAERILLGEPLRLTWGSGLSYPLALSAKAISFILGMSSADALKVAGIVLPAILGLVGLIAIYLAAYRIYDQRVALLSAFAWAIGSVPIFSFAAGYLDRDGLSLILILVGASAFYLSRDWPWRIRGVRIGWVMGVLVVLAIEVLLVIEWKWYGVVPLLAILSAFFVVDVLLKYAQYLAPSLVAEDDPLAWPLTAVRRSPSAIGAALKGSDWQPITAILGLSVVAAAYNFGLSPFFDKVAELFRNAFTGGGSTTLEMQGLTATDLLAYGFLTIPVLIGLYVATVNHRRADIFCLSWFAVMFIGGTLAKRLFVFAAPSVCILAAIGLASLFEFGKLRWSRANLELAFVDTRQLLSYAKAGLAVLLVLLPILASFSAYRLGSQRMVAANNDWEAALTYLRDNTPADAVVMSWWDYGYWILDIADRQPVVDNGNHNEAADRDIALAYVTEDDSKAAEIMEKHTAGHLVFSVVEYGILPGITDYGLGQPYGDGTSIPAEMRDSLYNRALSGDLEFGGGLRRVYPDSAVEKPTVVILCLGQGCG